MKIVDLKEILGHFCAIREDNTLWVLETITTPIHPHEPMQICLSRETLVWREVMFPDDIRLKPIQTDA